MRVAVIGSAGQLGTDLVHALSEAGHEPVALAHTDLEVTESGKVGEVIRDLRPDVVVNCAAYVRVDKAEDEPDLAFLVNALGALYVARACADSGAACVHVSTDYVFDGCKSSPYAEDDPPRPINVYGASKLAGEYLVRQACSESLIVRVASLFGRAGASGKGGNFIETILAKARAGEQLRVVNDVRMSPTYTRDAALAIVRLIEQEARGIVHLTNAGVCTWYDLAKTALDLLHVSADIEPITSDAYPTRAARPANSALAGTRVASILGAPLPAWKDALLRYLLEKGHLGEK